MAVLQREPAAIDIGPRGIEFLPPQRPDLRRGQIEDAQQLAAPGGVDRTFRRQAGHGHEAGIARRRQDGGISGVAARRRAGEQRGGIDARDHAGPDDICCGGWDAGMGLRSMTNFPG